jgi:hypothetical protein
MKNSEILDHFEFEYKPGNCLDATELREFLKGELKESDKDEIQYHINGCKKCRELVDLLIKEHWKEKFKT